MSTGDVNFENGQRKGIDFTNEKSKKWNLADNDLLFKVGLMHI